MDNYDAKSISVIFKELFLDTYLAEIEIIHIMTNLSNQNEMHTMETVLSILNRKNCEK